MVPKRPPVTAWLRRIELRSFAMKKKTRKDKVFSFNISEATHQYLHLFINVGNSNILKTISFFFNISHITYQLYTCFLTCIALFAGNHTFFFFVILGTSAALGSTAIPERHLYGSGAPPRVRPIEAHRTSQFDDDKINKIHRFFNISEATHQYLHLFINVGNSNILKTHQLFNIYHRKSQLYTCFLTCIALFAGNHTSFLLF